MITLKRTPVTPPPFYLKNTGHVGRIYLFTMAIYCYEKLMANELIVTEGDFQKRVDALSLTLNAQQVGVKEFLISLMVEHDRKDDIRFHSVEQSVIAVTSALKDSVNASTANMKDFLVTNNERITAAFTTLSGRF